MALALGPIEPTRFTAAQLQVLADGDIVIDNVLRRRLALTPEEFRDVLEEDVIAVIRQLEENPQAYAGDSEDQTTQRLVDMLKMMGYSAHHNKQTGGNVDLTVEVARRGFRWIGEAKIFGDVGDMREGYLQLATRYRPAVDPTGVLHGGLIGYLNRSNAAKHMADWMAHLQTLPVAAGLTLSACTRRGPLGFVSEHLHQDYGTPLRVWHVCAVLHFAPKDKSARNATKYRP